MNKVICSCFGMLFLLLAAACAKLPVQDCSSKTQGPLKELALNESDTIKVCAVEPLNPSGILVKKGYSYNLHVIPADQTWTDGPKLKPFTADGRTDLNVILLQPYIKMPFKSWFALLGSIDNKRCTYFKIGVQHNNYQPKKNGELICFANDAGGFNGYWYRHNNQGQLTLVITRVK